MDFQFNKDAFFYIRHGVTEFNLAERVMGRLDIPLHEDGRLQAEQVAQSLVGGPIRSIWSSPLSRALETAKIIGSALQLEVQELPGLMERDWGVFQGRPRSEREVNADPAEGESWVEFKGRVLTAMAAVTGPSPVLIVAHNGIRHVLMEHFGLADRNYQLPHGVVFQFFCSEDQRWQVSPQQK